MSHLVIQDDTWHALVEHLLQNDREQVAFGFSRVVDGAFVIEEVCPARPEDFSYQSSYHVELEEEFLTGVIRTASSSDRCLVEFHSHLSASYPAAFSVSDFKGFEEVVPHVRWRLRGAPYAAVVISPTGFDGLVWSDSSDRPTDLEEIHVGQTVHRGTGLSIQRWR